MFKQRKWKTGILFFTAMLAALVTTAAAMQQEQQALAGKLIRLHVVANSDSEEDQRLKLQVRDAVLALTEQAAQAEDPETALTGLLPELQTAAERCLQENGCQLPVQVELGWERFPTRYYDSFALPAGTYHALRVVIGAGEGHNWWCVAFPSICLRATASELEQAAQAAGLSEGEVRLITGEQTGVQLKFKTLELLEWVKKWMFG